MTKRRACPFASRAYSWRSNQSINTTSSKPRAVWEIHLGLDTGNKWDSCWAGHIRARGPRSSSVGLVVVYWCTGVFHEASLSLTGPRGPRPGIIASEWGPTSARGRGGIPFFVRKSKPVAGDAATSRHATPRARRESAGAARRHARERRPCRAPLDRHGWQGRQTIITTVVLCINNGSVVFVL